MMFDLMSYEPRKTLRRRTKNTVVVFFADLPESHRYPFGTILHRFYPPMELITARKSGALSEPEFAVACENHIGPLVLGIFEALNMLSLRDEDGFMLPIALVCDTPGKCQCAVFLETRDKWNDYVHSKRGK